MPKEHTKGQAVRMELKPSLSLKLDRIAPHPGCDIPPCMKAELKSIFSPEIDIASYTPDDPSRFLVNATLSIGIEGEDGAADDFNVLICSVRSLASLVAQAQALVARPLIIAERWDFPLILQRIQDYCASCEGEAWEDLVPMLARLGVWEFEHVNAGEPQPEY